MSSFSSALEYQSVPCQVFEQMRRSLSCLLTGDVSHLSERDLGDGQLSAEARIEKFTLLSTDQISLLLLAQHDGACSYLVSLCTDLKVIERFLALPWLVNGLRGDSHAAWTQLQQRITPSSQPSPQDIPLDNQTLIKLTHQLMLEVSGLEPCSPGQQPLSAATILQHLVTRLHRSEPLPLLLKTTLDEVCSWLRLDRLLIYQVAHSSAFPKQSEHRADEFLPIAYEALGHPAIGSVLPKLDSSPSDSPFLSQEFWHQCYGPASQENRYDAIENVALHYQAHPHLLDQLRQAGVGSQLVAPIWLDDTLWGWLVGHHCVGQAPISQGACRGGAARWAEDPDPFKESSTKLRHWQAWEGNFLAQIAEHLTIAIRQEDLQRQLQYQKLMLQLQVEDRTQSLKDALMSAEAANKTKSEFLATMSHELRTPLTYIIGMSATLLRWSFGDLSPRQRDYLNTIHSSGEQLLDIINDILEVAKIEAGRTVLEINDFSLSNLARSSLESFREEAQAKEVDLRINLRLSEAEDTFRADPRRIRQILANLLSNAVKFTEKDGRISLRVWRDPQNVMFQLEDTGIGIPEAQQASLFETFKQLETVRQRQYPGAGLGLALTKQLVELHNGAIQVVSTPGKGSMFTVRIPLQHADGAVSSFKSVEPITGRIILLEDDESSASLICDLLTAANYQVIWVIEGSRIVHQVEILQPVAIILNHHLVSGNSHYIVEDLKHYVDNSGIKVISLMDSEEMETLNGASPDGFIEEFDDYLAKPIDPSTLLSKIQMLPTN